MICTRIENNIQINLNKDFNLIYGSWGDIKLKTCCPLYVPNLYTEQDITCWWGKSDQWIKSFISGYDNLQDSLIKEASNLGMYFRNKYNPKEYYYFIND